MLTPDLKRAVLRVFRLRHHSQNDPLERRTTLAQTIADLSENGQIQIVYGGIDCDGGRWDDHTVIVPATVMHVRIWVQNYMDAAEGPQWWHLDRPSAQYQHSSRDLALEAFEEGHPHVIYA